MLLLFDIDGTLLLKASAEHAAALREALATVYGVTADGLRPVSAAGRTDTAIARDIAALAGVDNARFDAGLADFIEVCGRAYLERAPATLERHVAPGMRELLGSLALRDDVRCSLVTGNYEVVARLKLDRAGIGHHFEPGQGGFGSDAEERNELPAIARGRAGYPRERTLVIGDTPLDIACARADGIRVLAIATGLYAADELRGADAVATDARELTGLLDDALRA